MRKLLLKIMLSKLTFYLNFNKFSLTTIYIFSNLIFLGLPIHSEQFQSENLSKSSIVSNQTFKSVYLLDTNDILEIIFKGFQKYSGTYEVDIDGKINLPEIDKLYVRGKSIEELESELINKYSKYIYNSQVKVSIINQRVVNYYISGESRKPGLYKAQYGTKLFEAIKSSDGITNYADLSKVELVRKNSNSQGGGKIQSKINLLSMILMGDQSQNITLKDGDSIVIPRSSNPIKEQILAVENSNLNPDIVTVFITGNVEKPGSTTIKRGSTLNLAIASSGGKKIWTGDIEFIRFKNDGTTIKNRFRYDQNAKLNSKRNPILMNGDIINVNKTLMGKGSEVLTEIINPFLIFKGFSSL